ncbi:pentatricopeptide repeat-containing protein At2g34370, mitochondrial isoform X2 [Capsella rubella]|nr:pentatricopeptide repeat-containing protein At2g34370, mitochondrial isoform X2 [Capsella rubella]
MVRIICSSVLKFSKPKFWWGTQSSSSRCFSSRAQSHNHITKMVTSSLQNVSTRHTCQNRSFLLQCRRVSSNAQMSPTIETFDALCEEGRCREAIEVVERLEDEGCVVDLPRLLGLAKLCGQAEALEEARVVHDCITPLDVRSYNTLIEMYSGCGSTDDALNVFDEMPERDTETWCVMMRCLAKNGKGEQAIDMFTSFKAEGNIPDKEIFKAVFFVCVSLGDINEGLLHFESMYRDYGIVPSMEDYVSVTEMLAACGHLDEALEFVERMAVEPSFEVCETLMNLAWVHGELDLGDRFAELAKKLDATRMKKESNAGLVAAKASDSAKEKIKEIRRRWMIREEKTRMLSFKAGDTTSHPQSDKIVAALRSLKVQMLDMGFVPATKVLYWEALLEEEKEEKLLFGSHKLAVACGILSSPARKSFTVMKNLRTCVDSHNTLKMISEITGREIIARDKCRFHHYKNGGCSCQDY